MPEEYEGSKISGLTEATTPSGTYNLVVASSGSNLKLTLTTLKDWIITQLTNFVTLTGIQSLTNKTLIQPIINSGGGVTATSANINNLTGLNINAAEKFSTIDSTLTDHDNRLGDLEQDGETETWKIIARGASDSSLTINASDIDSAKQIDPERIHIAYYDVNNLISHMQSQDGITVYSTINSTLDKIVFDTTAGKTYKFVIKYRLLTE